MLIEAGENAWSLVLCDSLDMHILQAWNTILQLFIIWLVGILFESGVDDGRTYRQVAGSWVCSWWVTAVGRVPTTFKKPVVWIQSRLNTNSSSEIAQKLRLVSKRLCMETNGNLLFFSTSGFVRFPGFFWGTNNHEITSKQWPCDGWLRYNCMICQVHFSKTCSLPYHHP